MDRGDLGTVLRNNATQSGALRRGDIGEAVERRPQVHDAIAALTQARLRAMDAFEALSKRLEPVLRDRISTSGDKPESVKGVALANALRAEVDALDWLAEGIHETVNRLEI